MSLLNQAGAAVLLVTLTLCLQYAGLAALIGWVKRVLAGDVHKLGAFQAAALVIRSTVAVIALHGLQILLWATWYRAICLPSWESAFYYSSTSYSTVGYGDVVLPSEWRLLGPLESIIGVLMCGITVSLLFVLVTRLVGDKEESSNN
jgi:voltage-gated potassium channel